jgi:tetratricopeptide (TPR) repeat protein
MEQEFGTPLRKILTSGAASTVRCSFGGTPHGTPGRPADNVTLCNQGDQVTGLPQILFQSSSDPVSCAHGYRRKAAWRRIAPLHSIARSRRCRVVRHCRGHDQLWGSTNSAPIDDPWSRTFALLNIGAVHRKLQQFEDALEHFRRARITYREISDRWSEARTLLNIGDTLQELNQMEAAAEHWRQALPVFEDLDDSVIAAKARLSLEILNANNLDQRSDSWPEPK